MELVSAIWGENGLTNIPKLFSKVFIAVVSIIFIINFTQKSQELVDYEKIPTRNTLCPITKTVWPAITHHLHYYRRLYNNVGLITRR